MACANAKGVKRNLEDMAWGRGETGFRWRAALTIILGRHLGMREAVAKRPCTQVRRHQAGT